MAESYRVELHDAYGHLGVDIELSESDHAAAQRVADRLNAAAEEFDSPRRLVVPDSAVRPF